MGTSFFIQLLLLFIILLSPLTIAKTNATHAQTQCIGLEKSLLLELRKQLVFNSPYSRKLVQWNQSEDCCRWGGVRCDSGGHVIGLVLRDEGISGGLDESSSLFGLEYLEELDLSYNSLSGSIPLSIFTHLPSLSYLNLSCNMLVGLQKPYDIPASLSFRVLDLHSNKLEGELPFSLVHRAWYLDLSNNRLSGSFPTSICSTKRLQLLDLSNNNLTGTIPDCLFKNVESLEVLNLGRNGISGHIPDSFSIHSSLISLDLSDNSLVGDVPLSLAKCSSLLVLNLSGNKLSGTVPTNLTLFGRLTVLNLGKNNMTGHIPNFTADCPLQYLVLNNNNFIGGVPLSLANCKLLEVMNVEGNRIDGSFPCMLPSSLQVLVLRSNRFHGDVTCPKSKTRPNLQIIDIASNGFNGYLNSFNFPTWRGMTKDTVTKSTYKNLGFSFTMDNSWAYAYYKEEVTLTIKGVERKLVKIWPDFISIDFSDNNFHGGIPDSIGGLDALYLLNLSHNSLTGTIPESFGKLRQLESLDLSVNHIIGIIPTEIAGLTFLQIMNVSHNKLMGRIPVGTQIQSFSPDCFEGNAGLCGPPLNTSCNSETSSPKLAEGDDQESEGEETEWEYVFAAAAAGYAVGLGSFSWLLLICRSFRYKYFDKIEVVFDVIFDCCHSARREEVKEQELRGFSLPNRLL